MSGVSQVIGQQNSSPLVFSILLISVLWVKFKKIPFWIFCPIYFVHFLTISTSSYTYLPKGSLSNMDLIKPRDFEQSRLFTVSCMISQYFTFTNLAFAVVIMIKICNRIRDFPMFQELCHILYRHESHNPHNSPKK